MNFITRTVKSSVLLFSMYNCIKSLRSRFSNNLIIRNKGGAVRIKRELSGSGHELVVGEGTFLNGTTIHMKGKNNRIVFGKNCVIGKNCSFWTEGSNVSIIVGDNVTFTQNCHINAQECGMCITIGDDCMFSNTIIVRTSDSHPIYSLDTGERINPPKPVVIGRHVWIAPNSKIMKGVTIGDGCIIGSDTMVTKDVPAKSLAVGHPARIVKNNISWTREDVVFCSHT